MNVRLSAGNRLLPLTAVGRTRAHTSVHAPRVGVATSRPRPSRQIRTCAGFLHSSGRGGSGLARVRFVEYLGWTLSEFSSISPEPPRQQKWQVLQTRATTTGVARSASGTRTIRGYSADKRDRTRCPAEAVAWLSN